MDEDEKQAAKNHEEALRNQAMYVAGQVVAGIFHGRADFAPSTVNYYLEQIYHQTLSLLKEAIIHP